MSLKKLGLSRFDFWTLITILGYIIVLLLLILPLFNIFKASFIDKETGALSLSNYREFFSKKYYTSAIPNSLLVSFGGTFNGNPVSLAAARANLDELSRDDGALLKEANRLGGRLMDGIAKLASQHSIALLVSGFGAAFSVHFTSREKLVEYRDILDDDPAWFCKTFDP